MRIFNVTTGKMKENFNKNTGELLIVFGASFVLLLISVNIFTIFVDLTPTVKISLDMLAFEVPLEILNNAMLAGQYNDAVIRHAALADMLIELWVLEAVMLFITLMLSWWFFVNAFELLLYGKKVSNDDLLEELKELKGLVEGMKK